MGQSVGQEKDKDKDKPVVTKASIPKLPDGTYRVSDGLYLRKRAGRGSYFFRVMVSKVRHDISIGSSSVISIQEAKDKAAALRVEIASGGKPWERDVDKNVRLSEYWEKAVETYAVSRHWKRHARMLSIMKHRISAFVIPVIGSIPVKDITRKDVLKVIGPMWSEKPILADNVRFALEKVLGMAVTSGIIEVNPAVIKGNLEYFLPPKSKVMRPGHWASADFETTRKMVRYFMSEPHEAWKCLVLLIVTARRASEGVNAKWEHIDLDAGIWTVPNEVMKVDRGFDRRVPLPRQMCEIMRTWERKGEYVFTSNRTDHIITNNLLNSLHRAFPGPTVHGFRSTFTSWCADNGMDVEVVEACLDHSSGTVVRQAYQRSDLLERRREVIQKYADALFAE